MHVMEDVEEGCNVSGALPSSPGHAEQRPGLAKDSPSATEANDPHSPITNGLSHSDQHSEPNTAPNSPKSDSDGNKSEEKSNKECEPPRRNSSAQQEENKETPPNEDSNSNDSDISNKRKCDEEESPAKKLRTQIQQQFVTHDKILAEYLENSGCNTIEDLQAHSEQLLAEIRTLNELAREKEREWNNILHVKKIKEELLLRMQRKRQILLLTAEKGDIEWDLSSENHISEGFDKRDSLKANNNGLMMVPIVSSSPANLKNNQTKTNAKPRSILPKPNPNIDFNLQNEGRTGRQGPILDVRSIIADYRQRHPETVPRRGRRLRSVLNNTFGETVVTSSGKQGTITNLTSIGLGSGAQIRHGDVTGELGLLLSSMDAASKQDSRPSSADSSSLLNSEATMSFKDVLVQFARLSQGERQELQAAAAAGLTGSSHNKPPYPEVTLHAVNSVGVTNTPTQGAAANNASLLHGILTKNQGKSDGNKPTTFSPTLARLLTAPERVSNTNAQAVYNVAAAALNSGVSISDLLTTNHKSRNEITITPIGQYGQNTKKEAENIGDEEAEDSADRLVIDEGGQESEGRQRTDAGSEAGDDVPQCQGCHQKSAQFVCAGCGNQWYCSRDCQVAAWDEHSEVCSG